MDTKETGDRRHIFDPFLEAWSRPKDCACVRAKLVKTRPFCRYMCTYSSFQTKDLRYCKYLLTVAPVDGTASRPSQQVTHSQNLRAELIKKTLLNSTSTTFKITTKNFVFSRLNVTSPNQMHGMTIEGNCSSNGVTRSYNSCRITHSHALTKR